MMGSSTPNETRISDTAVRSRRPAIVVNSPGTFRMNSFPTRNTEMGTLLGSQAYGDVTSPRFSRMGLGAWQATSSSDGSDKKDLTSFQKGFVLERLEREIERRREGTGW